MSVNQSFNNSIASFRLAYHLCSGTSLVYKSITQQNYFFRRLWMCKHISFSTTIETMPRPVAHTSLCVDIPMSCCTLTLALVVDLDSRFWQEKWSNITNCSSEGPSVVLTIRSVPCTGKYRVNWQVLLWSCQCIWLCRRSVIIQQSWL